LHDPNVSGFYGATVESFKDLSEDEGRNLFHKGNCKLIEEYVKDKLKKDDIKHVFFGDYYTSDGYWPAQRKNWDNIIVLEEMATREEEFKAIEDACEYKAIDHGVTDYGKVWGDYFLHDKENPKKNYYVEKIAEESRYAVTLVRHIKLMID